MSGVHVWVKAEREQRGLSVREAATLGGVSNQTWGRFEAGGPLTGKMRRAVARAFGVPTTWPDQMTATHLVAVDDVSSPDEDVPPWAPIEMATAGLARLDSLALQVETLAALVAQLTEDVAQLKQHRSEPT